MENKHLYKISKNLSELVDKKSLDKIYSAVIDFKKKHSDYFVAKKIDSMDLLKIVFLIYSYKYWNDFKIGESIIKNLYFFKLIKTNGEFIKETCEECDGSGSIPCNSCNGDGTFECSECDGRGKVSDGDSDEIECEECSGEGNIECNECSGDGSTDCDSCEGIGEIETNNYEYEVSDCCYWTKEFFSLIVDSYELHESIKYQEVIENNSDYIVLSTYKIENDNLCDDPDELYCAYLTYEPNFVSTNAELRLSNTTINDYLDNC